ncbi:MAG TPA: chain length determinant protein tyrosine kinase EpsG [Burkholderiaceae bacterium]|nr:chain length determinant protein tyrosine kinase EpsG [Burkholderiaceae bacterium]
MNPTGVVHKMNLPVTPHPAPEPAKPSADMRIGQILAARGRLTAAQIAKTLDEQTRTRQRFGETAVRLGLVMPKDVDDALALQFGYTALEPTTAPFSPAVVAAFAPASPFVEALRGLRSQLMMRWFDGTPGQTALAVTSVDRGDGKSFITANLGVVFAQLGENTLIIDADLRHPTQHHNFGLPNRMGLSGVLSRRAGLEEIVPVPAVGNLSLLPSGPLPPNPQELLGRPEFSRLLNELSSVYDVILVDTPSAQQSSDAHVVAQRAGAALIVGRKDRTRSAEIAQLAGIMSNSGIQILGTTLNQP